MTTTTLPTLFMVSAEPTEIDVVQQAFGATHCLVKLDTHQSLIHALESKIPALIITAEQFSDGSGFDICKGVPHVPVFVLLSSGNDQEHLAFEAGAADVLCRPIVPANFKARVQHQLTLQKLKTEHDRQLLAEVNRHNRLLEEMQDLSMVAMGSLAETRDPETGNHIRRTQRYVKVLAQALKHHPKYADFFTDEVIASLYKSAPLHDIGKIGIPDHILLKPGSLTFEEFEIMKKHTLYGRDAIVAAERNMTENEDFLTFAREIAYSHHEMWNGQGYPEGLAGEAIPVAARLMSIADVYDALISRRVYKPATSHEAAVSMIVKSKGIQFDPDMIDAFLTVTDVYRQIADEFAYTYRESSSD